MNRSGVVGLLALVLSSGIARAAPEDFLPPAIFPGESKPTAQRLAEARKCFDDGKMAEGIEELQQILDAFGDDLAPVDAGRAVRAKRLCHALLASLPPAGLEQYRKKVEPQARKWLERAKPDRDARLLRKIVDEAFCSRAGEDALNLLGDLAFERGNLEEAASWWRFLLPPSIKDRGLAYPDPIQPAARIEAKLWLARHFNDPSGNGAVALKKYRAVHGEASGSLAGKTGRFADILQEIAEAPSPPTLSHWSTFGGDAERGRIEPGGPRVVERLGQLLRDGPEWRFSLGERKKLDGSGLPFGRIVKPVAAAARLAFHPLIANEKVLVADARFVTAFDLRTGVVENWFDAATQPGGLDASVQLPAAPDLRFTLTIAEGCLFARLGAQEMSPGPDKAVRASFLACLRLEPAEGESRLHWLAVPPEGAIFEGAPVVRDGLAYIAAARGTAGKIVTAVLCYPIDVAGRSTPRWQVDVCETRETKPTERLRHHLLTLAGPNVIYCTHDGAVVAVDGRAGKRLWAVRYPSRGARPKGDDAWPHDLAPALVAGGTLYVAPADADTLYCLDPISGKVLWQRERLHVVHLLGVGAGQLIFATSTGLRAVVAETGSDAGGWGPLPDDGSSLRPVGRGFLFGELVLWPTERGVFAVRQRDGKQADNPAVLANLTPGNLVYSDGCLVVAGAEILSVFVSPAFRLDARKKEALRLPTAANLLRLALAEANAGLPEQALRNLQKAVGDPDVSEKVARRGLEAKRGIVLEQVRLAIARGEPSEAEKWLTAAVGDGFSSEARTRALQLAASWWCDAGDAERAAAAWKTILSSPALRSAAATDARGLPCSGAVLATRALEPTLAKVTDAKFARATKTVEFAGKAEPLRRTWHLSLEKGQELFPLSESENEGDVLLVGPARHARRLQARDGKERWRVELGFAPCWAADLGTAILLAGAGGAAKVRSTDGGLLWEMPAPAGENFSAFQTAGERFYCLMGERRLLAVALDRGLPLWASWAPGGPWRTSGGIFLGFSANGDRIMAQAGCGRAFLLDGVSGNALADFPAPETPWIRKPLAIGSSWCLVESAHRVTLRDGNTGKEIWAYAPAGFTTLTGEPPQMLQADSSLLVLISTNLGYEVHALESLTGKERWSRPILFPDLAMDVSRWAVGPDHFYLARQGFLLSWSLADGKLRWQQPLAGAVGAWQLQRHGECVVAYPVQGSVRRFQFRWLLGSLQCNVYRLPRESYIAGVPVFLCEARTGRFVQRLNFEREEPRLQMKIAAADFIPMPKLQIGRGIETVPRVRVFEHGDGLTAICGRDVHGLSRREP